MDTLLDALQEGRLIELPDNNKDHALQFLAHILEAIPSVPIGTDVVGLVMEREHATSTAIGKGWACPHARVPFDEDLMCVVGGVRRGSITVPPMQCRCRSSPCIWCRRTSGIITCVKSPCSQRP